MRRPAVLVRWSSPRSLDPQPWSPPSPSQCACTDTRTHKQTVKLFYIQRQQTSGCGCQWWITLTPQPAEVSWSSRRKSARMRTRTKYINNRWMSLAVIRALSYFLRLRCSQTDNFNSPPKIWSRRKWKVSLKSGYCKKIAASGLIVTGSATAADIHCSTSVQSDLTYVQLKNLCCRVSGQRHSGHKALFVTWSRNKYELTGTTWCRMRHSRSRDRGERRRSLSRLNAAVKLMCGNFDTTTGAEYADVCSFS